jgi:glycosyltransferase involved in cell wall biosynthesis
LKILYLYKDYYPVLGGIENHIRMLAEGFVQRGHRVTVLVCDPGRRTRTESLNGVQVIKAGRLGTAASMPLSPAQPWILAQQRPDIVHIHSPYPLGETANWLLGRARATVITHHSDIVRQRGWLRFYGPMLRRVLAAADRVIVDSPPYVSLSPWLQPVRDKCVVAPIGVDAVRFSSAAARSDGPVTLLFVGRLRYYKGLHTLLHALAQVPEVRLNIVGDGPMRDDLQALASELDLNDRVVFATEVDDDDLPGWYRRSDVFVLPSNAKSEAYGIVLLEAMASGLPCITTELGTGTSWIVRHKETGLVAPPDDPGALAEAIRSLAADAELRQRMGAAGRRRIETEFTVEGMLDRVEGVYEERLAQHVNT